MTTLFLTFFMLQAIPDCNKVFTTGLQEYQQKKFTQALISFQSAVQCNPKFEQAYMAIADVYALRGNDSQAIEALLKATQIRPDNSLTLRALSTLYLKNGMHLKALPLLETLVRFTPESADTHSDLAAVYATKGDQESAELSFRRALQLQPDFFAALAGLGNLLARSGNNDDALPLLQKAVQAKPDTYEGHLLLGSLFNRMNRFTEAKNELELSAKNGGNKDPQVYYQLARAWGGLGNTVERRKALEYFSTLTRSEKDYTEKQRQASAWIEEAREFLQKGELALAIKRLESALQVNANDATLMFRIAGLNYDLQHFDAARKYVQAAIEITPSVWLYHYLLGLIERSSHRFSEAKSSLLTAATLQPTEAPVLNALGELLMLTGEYNSAITAFEKAEKLSPDDVTIQQNLESARKRR